MFPPQRAELGHRGAIDARFSIRKTELNVPLRERSWSTTEAVRSEASHQGSPGRVTLGPGFSDILLLVFINRAMEEGDPSV